MNSLKLGFIIVIAALLSACTANSHSIHRYHGVDRPASNITLVDAKQRAILSTVPDVKSLAKAAGITEAAVLDKFDSDVTFRRFCAEPSPDVLSAIANSASFGGAFGQTSQPAGLDISANGSFNSAEIAATIPRTQTLNLLRELMFRTCERYLNHAIDELELSVQAVRDQRLMVSILAIEQLTGAVTPKPVVISAQGTGTAGAGAAAIESLTAARTDMISARSALTSAQEEYDSIKLADGDAKGSTCEAILKAVEEDKTDDLTDKQKEKLEPCKKAGTTLAAAKKRFGDANEHYSLVKQLAAAGGVTTATETDVLAPGGIDQAQAVSNVAQTVEHIVDKNFNDGSESLLFCMRMLQMIGDSSLKLSDASRQRIEAKCLAYLEANISADEARAKLNAQEIYRQLNVISTSKLQNFNQFFLDFGCTEGSAPMCRGVAEAMARAFPGGLTPQQAQTLQQLQSATTRDALHDAFDDLAVNQQSLIIAKR